jgi:epoxyqueuosine reductase
MQTFIKQKALEIGFDACGIAKAEALNDDAAFMKIWLVAGMHADMQYLERNFEKRINPAVLVPETKSVVVVLLNYYPEKNQTADVPRIARYAHSEIDYHTVIKSMLAKLETDIVEKYGADVVNSAFQHCFVDSAPILERRWAQRAGLGWIGKHTQLIAPNIGSYCFIGIMLLNKELAYDNPLPDRCGTCTRCIVACPTNALNGRSLDARKCISYQTIENKNSVANEIKPKLSGCVLGCDICADVCPWNKKWAKPHRNKLLKPVDEIYTYQKVDWQTLTNEKFNLIFKKSAIKRAGYEKLKENILMMSPL